MLFKNFAFSTFLVMAALLSTSTAGAAPLTFNVDGVISDSNNLPLEAAAVTFRVEVRNSDESCILYREDFNVNMTGSSGYFSIAIGNAINAIGGGVTLDKVFSNLPIAIPGESCIHIPATTTETRKIVVSFNDGVTAQVFSSQDVQSVPFALESAQTHKVGGYGASELLKVDAAVNQTGGNFNQTQYDELLRLLNAPLSAYISAATSAAGDVTGTFGALKVEKIQNLPVVVPTAGDSGKFLQYDGTGWVMGNAAAPTVASYSATGVVQFDTDAATSGINIDGAGKAKVNTGTAANQIVKLDGAAKLPAMDGSQLTGVVASSIANDSVTSAKILDGEIVNADIATGAAIAWSKIASPTTLTGYGITDNLVKNNGNTPGVSAGTDAAKPGAPVAGELYIAVDTGKIYRWDGTWDVVASKSAALVAGDITTALGFTPLNKAGDVMTGNLGLNAVAADPAGLVAGDAGKVWYNTSDGKIKYWNGSAAVPLGVAGSGLQSINGLTANDQSFVTSTTGNTLVFNSVTDTHTLNIPMASNDVSVTGGLISNADYVAMMAKQSNTLAASQVWVGNASGGAEARALFGDIASVSNVGLVTVNKTTTGLADTIVSTDGTGTIDAYGYGINGSTSGTVDLLTQATTANYALTFPAAAPSADQMLQSDAFGNFSWVNAPSFSMPGLAAGNIWVGNSSGGYEARAPSGDIASISNTGLVTLASVGSAGTYFKVQTDVQGRVVAGWALASTDVTGALSYTPVNRAGDTMVGDLDMGGKKIIGLKNVPNVATDPGAPEDTKSLRWNNTTAQWEWFTPAAAGAGITSFNGATQNTQTLASIDLGTSVTAPAWNTNTGTGAHTLQIPMAVNAGVTAGLLSKTDFDRIGTVADGYITSAKIADGTIVNADIAAGAAIAWSKIVSPTNLAGYGITDAVKNNGNTPGVSAGNDAAKPGTPAPGELYIAVDTGKIYRWDGTATWDVVASKDSGVSNTAALSNGKVWIGNGSGKAEEQTLSGDATISSVGLLTLKNTGTVGTYYKVETDAQGRVVSGAALIAGDITTALGYTPLNKAGDVMTGNLGLNAVAADPVGLVAGDAGKVWYNTSNNQIKYWNGSAAVPLGAAGSGLQSLNSLTANNQSFAISTSGNTLVFNSVTDTHTLNIPMASNDVSVTGGLISNADYVAMMNKQSNALAASQVWVGNASGSAEARTLSGDVIISNVGLVTVDKTQTAEINKILQLSSTGAAYTKGVDINGGGAGSLAIRYPNSGSTTTLTFPASTGSLNQVLQTDGSGVLNWSTVLTGISNFADLSNTKIWVGNGSGKAAEVNISGDASLANDGTLNLASVGIAGTYFKVTTDAKGRVTSGAALASGDVTTALGYAPLNRAGDTMAGDLDMGSHKIIGLKNVPNAANDPGVTEDTMSLRWNNTTAQWEWFTPAAAGAGITSFNGATQNTQTLASIDLGTSVTAPAWSTNTGTGAHTLQIPMAVNAGVTAGLLSKTDFDRIGTVADSYITSAKIADGTIVNADIAAGAAIAWSKIVSPTNLAGYGITDAVKNNGNTPGVSSGNENPKPSSPATGELYIAVDSGKIYSWNGTSWDIVATRDGAAPPALNSGDVTTALGYTPLNKAGDTMTGSLYMGDNQFFKLSNHPSATGATTGQIWYDSGTIKYHNGTGVVDLGVAGASITSINGSTASTQSFMTPGTAGNAPAWSVNAGAGEHTLNIPMAAASGTVVAGLISNADYSTMMSKQSNALAASQVWVGNASGGAEARALSGDVTISNVGLVIANKTTTGQSDKLLSLDGSGVANVKGLDIQTGTGKVTLQTAGAFTNYILTLPAAAPAVNQILKSDASGNLGWATATNGDFLADGSVSMTGPLKASAGDFNSPGITFSTDTNTGLFLPAADILGITTGGTERARFNSAGDFGIGTTAPSTRLNVVGGAILAGPKGTAVGDGGEIRFGELSVNGTNYVGFKAPDLLAANAVWRLPAADGSSGQVLSTDGAGVLTWASPIMDNLGNHTATQNIILGTNWLSGDGGAEGIRVDPTGRVGIGTSAPLSTLEIAGTSSFGSDVAIKGTGSDIGLTLNNTGTGGRNYNITSSNNASGGAGAGKFSIADATAGATRLVIDSVGNIGMGTNAPNSKLHVTGGAVLAGPKGAAAGDGGEIRFGELSVNGANYVGFKAPDVLATNAVWRLPAADGSSGQVLSTNGSGVLSWASPIMDNLGNHTATTNITLGANWLSGDGDAEGLRVDAAGNVGVGVANPTNKLEVSGNIQATNGQVVANQTVVDSGATVDFNTGNVQVLAAPGISTINLNSMKDGGSYTLIITDTTSRIYTFPACTNSHFVPANDATLAGSQTIYNILKVTIGGATHCYISWVTGF